MKCKKQCIKCNDLFKLCMRYFNKNMNIFRLTANPITGGVFYGKFNPKRNVFITGPKES